MPLAGVVAVRRWEDRNGLPWAVVSAGGCGDAGRAAVGGRGCAVRRDGAVRAGAAGRPARREPGDAGADRPRLRPARLPR
ncbi:hypothetical protein EIY87_20380 [Amycolatopsis eburnea]|uniref:Uncharacterized protein n=1 Tax=Amycolatopsis eburnea TaxID=2267691 RepID=A0A3R9E374_9PSEU|nr:hypothetical protein EIY87_20380 [Amycolatopsis eburnea]